MTSPHWAFDVVILGGGSLAETCGPELAAAGRRVAVVEERRVGGECAYVACMPSKALLRSAAVRRLAARAAELGAAAAPPDLGDGRSAWPGAVARRDDVAEHRDDTAAARALADAGVTVIRGRGRILRPGRLGVAGGEVLEWTDLVLNTGSRPLIPPIEGLEGVDAWTSDRALSSDELPGDLVLLGGSAVGCELAQAYSAFGVRVQVVESAPRLLFREDPEIGELLAGVLEEGGVSLHLGATVTRARRATPRGRVVLELEGGGEIAGDRLLLAAGRRPNVEDIGLESLGMEPAPAGLEIDDRCRLRTHEHVFAGGDVTGVAPFTHTAIHHGRVIAAALLGRPLRAERRAIPRAVYTTPPMAAVGMTLDEARAAGVDAVSGSATGAAVARSASEGEPRGLLILVADRRREVLIGAAAVAPEADAFIGEATLAIRAELPLDLLAAAVRPFPSFAQLYDSALGALIART